MGLDYIRHKVWWVSLSMIVWLQQKTAEITIISNITNVALRVSLVMINILQNCYQPYAQPCWKKQELQGRILLKNQWNMNVIIKNLGISDCTLVLPQNFFHKGHLTSQTTLQLIHCVSRLFHKDEMILLQLFCCSAAGFVVHKLKSCNTYAFGQSLMLTSTALRSKQKCDLTSRECHEFLEY